jgi:hypothetical protein
LIEQVVDIIAANARLNCRVSDESQKTTLLRLTNPAQRPWQVSNAQGEMAGISLPGKRTFVGYPIASEQLLPLDYDELRNLASQRLRNEKPGQTLQTTALVHEASMVH